MAKQVQLNKRERAAKRAIRAKREAYEDARKDTLKSDRVLYPEWYSQGSKSTR